MHFQNLISVACSTCLVDLCHFKKCPPDEVLIRTKILTEYCNDCTEFMKTKGIKCWSIAKICILIRSRLVAIRWFAINTSWILFCNLLGWLVNSKEGPKCHWQGRRRIWKSGRPSSNVVRKICLPGWGRVNYQNLGTYRSWQYSRVWNKCTPLNKRSPLENLSKRIIVGPFLPYTMKSGIRP